jgi:hypothetical protein
VISVEVLVAVLVNVYDQVIFLDVDTSYRLRVGSYLSLLSMTLLCGDPTLSIIYNLPLIPVILMDLAVSLSTRLVQVLSGAPVRATSL